MDNLDLEIGDMNCEKCAARLSGVLNGATGIKRAAVLFDERKATVAFRAQTITEDKIIALIKRAGFSAAKV